MNQKTEQNQNNKGTEQEAQQQAQQTQQEAPVVAQQQAQEQQKSGFGNWMKRHWKGVVGTVTGALAVGGSAIVAYKKGKAAGAVMQTQQEDDNSLNPNI